MKTTRLSALLLSLLLLLSACGTKRQDTPDPDPAPDPAPVTPQPVEKTPDERIDDIIADMSLEEKVGQLFFVRCPETGAAEDVASYHLGGLLLFGRDYKDASGEWLTEDDFTSSLASYQAAAAIPLFIGSDDAIRNAFAVEPKDNTVFLPGVMSRKKQVIPMLTTLWG